MSTQTLRSSRFYSGFYLPGRAQWRLSGASCLDLICLLSGQKSSERHSEAEFDGNGLDGEGRGGNERPCNDGLPGHLRQFALDTFNYDGIKGIFGDPRWSHADV